MTLVDGVRPTADDRLHQKHVLVMRDGQNEKVLLNKELTRINRFK